MHSHICIRMLHKNVENSLSLSRQCNSSSKRMEYDRKKEGKIDIDCKLAASIRIFMVVIILTRLPILCFFHIC